MDLGNNLGWQQSGTIFLIRGKTLGWGQHFGCGVKVMGLGQNFGWGQNFSQSNVLGQGKILGQGHYLGSGQHSGSRAIIWIGSNILGEGKYFRSGVMFWVG